MNTGWMLTLVVFTALLIICSSEIHRAKVPSSKLTNSFRASTLNKQINKYQLKDQDTDRSFLGHHVDVWIYSIVSSVFVGLSGIFPLFIIPRTVGENLSNGGTSTGLLRMLSFAVGGLLGDVFLHLLPETWNNLSKEHSHTAYTYTGLWVITGILGFFVASKFFPDQENEADSKSQNSETQSEVSTCHIKNGDLKNGTVKQRKQRVKSDQNGNGVLPTQQEVNEPVPQETSIKVTGWLNLMANVIDNFTHGLAVAASYSTGIKSGVLTTVIILLHEVPHEVGDFAILLRSGFDRWKAAKAQLATASGAVFGAIFALLAESTQVAGDNTAWVLPFTAGGFIYIALVTVLPDLLKETDPKESLIQVLCLLCGIAVMATAGVYLDEHDLGMMTHTSDT